MIRKKLKRNHAQKRSNKIRSSGMAITVLKLFFFAFFQSSSFDLIPGAPGSAEPQLGITLCLYGNYVWTSSPRQ
jgi:coproporphyrinogen III oxidase-like Fe-S oxidoreductase